MCLGIFRMDCLSTLHCRFPSLFFPFLTHGAPTQWRCRFEMASLWRALPLSLCVQTWDFSHLLSRPYLATFCIFHCWHVSVKLWLTGILRGGGSGWTISWLNWKLFRKPLLLKIFPKYISTLFSGVRQQRWRNIVHSCLEGLQNKFSKAANCSSVLSFARKLPLSGLVRQQGFQTLTILFKTSFSHLNGGLTSHQGDKTKTRRPLALPFPSSTSRFHSLQCPLASKADSSFTCVPDHSLQPSLWGYPSLCPFCGSFIFSQSTDMPINIPVSLFQKNLSLHLSFPWRLSPWFHCQSPRVGTATTCIYFLTSIHSIALSLLL